MEIPAGAFDGVKSIIANLKDYETCSANIDSLFKKMDVNNDGFIDRCEDALFQKYMGSADDYAIKFSAAFDIYNFRALCNDFKY